MKAKQQQWLHFGNYPRHSCEEQEQLLSPSRSSGIWDLKALEWRTATSNANQTESYSSNEDVVLGHANLEDSFASILSFLLLLAFKPSSSSGCHSIRSKMFSIVLHLLLLPLLAGCRAAVLLIHCNLLVKEKYSFEGTRRRDGDADEEEAQRRFVNTRTSYAKNIF